MASNSQRCNGSKARRSLARQLARHAQIANTIASAVDSINEGRPVARQPLTDALRSAEELGVLPASSELEPQLARLRLFSGIGLLDNPACSAFSPPSDATNELRALIELCLLVHPSGRPILDDLVNAIADADADRALNCRARLAVFALGDLPV